MMTSYVATFRKESGRHTHLEVTISAPTLPLARVAAARYAATDPKVEVADVRELPHTLKVTLDGAIWISRFEDDDWEPLSKEPQ